MKEERMREEYEIFASPAMKKFLFIFVLIYSVQVKAQEPFRVTGDAGLDISINNGKNVSFRLGGGTFVTKELFMGATVGYTKLKNLNKPLVPLSLKFHYAFPTHTMFYPFLVAEPGYHFYKDEIVVDTRKIVTRGGFNIFAGGGLGYITESETRFYIAGGLSLYSFHQENSSTRSRRISLRLGMIL